MAAVYFACSYWMDKYNLLRLFATRSASDCAVGAGIVRTLSIYSRQPIYSSQSLWLRCDHSVRHSTAQALIQRLSPTVLACLPQPSHALLCVSTCRAAFAY